MVTVFNPHCLHDTFPSNEHPRSRQCVAPGSVRSQKRSECTRNVPQISGNTDSQVQGLFTLCRKHSFCALSGTLAVEIMPFTLSKGYHQHPSTHSHMVLSEDSSVRSVVNAQLEDLCPEAFRGHKAREMPSLRFRGANIYPEPDW